MVSFFTIELKLSLKVSHSVWLPENLGNDSLGRLECVVISCTGEVAATEAGVVGASLAAILSRSSPFVSAYASSILSYLLLQSIFPSSARLHVDIVVCAFETTIQIGQRLSVTSFLIGVG